MIGCCCGWCEPERERDMQPVPGKPGRFYDANLGPWNEGRSMSTVVPPAVWRKLFAGATA